MSYKIIRKFSSILGNSITGRDSSKVFKSDSRRSIDFPDLAELEKIVQKDEPYMNLLIGKQKFQEDYSYVDYSDVIEISDITHEGISSISYEIVGDHRGNNNYILEIIQSGPLGTAMYKLSGDGGETFSAPCAIPGDGQISVGDGTSFIFSEGSLTSGDRYLWATTSIRKERYRTDSFTITLHVHIYTRLKCELVGDEKYDGYLDIIETLVREKRGFHDDDVIFAMKLDQDTHPEIGERGSLNHGVISLIIEGSLYSYNELDLLNAVSVEVL